MYMNTQLGFVEQARHTYLYLKLSIKVYTSCIMGIAISVLGMIAQNDILYLKTRHCKYYTLNTMHIQIIMGKKPSKPISMKI